MRAELAHTLAIAVKVRSRKILAELKQLATSATTFRVQHSSGLLRLGNKDETFNSLERAFQDRADYLVFLKLILDSIGFTVMHDSQVWPNESGSYEANSPFTHIHTTREGV